MSGLAACCGSVVVCVLIECYVVVGLFVCIFSVLLSLRFFVLFV